MSPKLEQKLIEKYPVLFRDKDKSPRESLMCFGCEFSDGWYNIFDNLCDYLSLLAGHEMMLRVKDEYKTDENKGYIWVKSPTVSFTQVKEKYGTMRVYWIGNGIDNYDDINSKLANPEDMESQVKRYYDKVEHAIDYTEFLSSTVCEVCGESGKLYTNGWYMTRCKKHIIEHYGFDPDEEENETIPKL